MRSPASRLSLLHEPHTPAGFQYGRLKSREGAKTRRIPTIPRSLLGPLEGITGVLPKEIQVIGRETPEVIEPRGHGNVGDGLFLANAFGEDPASGIETTGFDIVGRAYLEVGGKAALQGAQTRPCMSTKLFGSNDVVQVVLNKSLGP